MLLTLLNRNSHKTEIDYLSNNVRTTERTHGNNLLDRRLHFAESILKVSIALHRRKSTDKI